MSTKSTKQTLAEAIHDVAAEVRDLLLRIARAAGECSTIEQATVLLDLESLKKRLKTSRYKYQRLAPPDDDATPQ
jgi:hypothetical protein